MVCIFISLVKDENKLDFKKIVSDNWMEPPKRERKRKYVFNLWTVFHLLVNSHSQNDKYSLFHF